MLAADAVSASVRRLVIALPPAIRFRFRAGMHVELKTPGVTKPRTYSIACAPDDPGLAPDGLLEFFITRHEPGQASGWLHKAELGAAIDLHGPLRQLPPAAGRRRPAAVPGWRVGPGADPLDRAPRARDAAMPIR